MSDAIRARAWVCSAYGVGTAHVPTSTQDGTVEQKEQKEVKYVVPFGFTVLDKSNIPDILAKI